ncbi:MAG: hypothetical protein PHW32_04025 [Bacilli bacterium]|nr:hypothetical protein [Bacilli bacterium]MDD4283093.1 hypothetical protein [Bacilli bacterium]MDD4719163.1 hypothetical protein [Bacilli bacterium]
MIKKIITIILFILVINILITFKKEDNIKPVFSESENNSIDYAIYDLRVDDLGITTKNLNNYFFDRDIKILGITPKINSLYQKKLDNQARYYAFKNKTISNNINEFESTFKALLGKYGFNGEIEKVDLNGVGISKIKIYASDSKVRKLINNYSKIKIQ